MTQRLRLTDRLVAIAITIVKHALFLSCKMAEKHTLTSHSTDSTENIEGYFDVFDHIVVLTIFLIVYFKVRFSGVCMFARACRYVCLG